MNKKTNDDPYYTWITENVAIGELSSSYKPFDIVVNLAYINPSYNKGLEHRHHRVTNNKYEFGIYDNDKDADYLYEILEYLIPILINNNYQMPKNSKILFHCQSGKSRSVSVAIAYLCKSLDISTDDCMEIIKNKRSIVNPRLTFINSVNKYLSTNF